MFAMKCCETRTYIEYAVRIDNDEKIWFIAKI